MAELKPLAASQTSPAANKQGKVCYVDVFKLTDLPDIIDKNGWKVSSLLMRRWLTSPAHEMTPREKEGKTNPHSYPVVDTTSVTMKWALSYPRLKQEYDEIFGSKGLFSNTPPIYQSAPAFKELISKLLRHGKFATWPESFGSFSSSVPSINEESQLQFKKVGDNSFKAASYGSALASDVVRGDPDLDDPWVAPGDFSFKIAGEGVVTPKTKSVVRGTTCDIEVEYYDVQVNRIGVYIRDSYDFNGDQYLGHWRKNAAPHIRFYMGANRGTCPDDYVEVNNGHFQAHRKKPARAVIC